MSKTELPLIYKQAMQIGELRAALRWIVNHSHECLDDHPSVLAHMRKTLEDTEAAETEPTK